MFEIDALQDVRKRNRREVFFYIEGERPGSRECGAMPAETEGKVCFSHARFSVTWIFHKILKDFERF